MVRVLNAIAAPLLFCSARDARVRQLILRSEILPKRRREHERPYCSIFAIYVTIQPRNVERLEW
jgi:hypothetical protein